MLGVEPLALVEGVRSTWVARLSLVRIIPVGLALVGGRAPLPVNPLA